MSSDVKMIQTKNRILPLKCQYCVDTDCINKK